MGSTVIESGTLVSSLPVGQVSALSGKHLIISGLSNAFSFNLERNLSGHITKISGVGGRLLDWLSLYHNFSYSPLQIDNDIDFDDIRKGLAGLILRNECDIVGAVMPTLSRAELVDFSHPVVYNSGYYLIPTSTEILFNMSTLILPFQPLVWIGLALAILAVLISLYSLNHWYFSKKENAKAGNINMNSNRHRITDYVFGLLLSQARIDPLKSKPVPTPLLSIVAVWGFGAVILIVFYTNLLTSYMAAPSNQPLIKSVQELIDRPDMWIVTDKNRNSESLLMSAKLGVLKDLGDKLRIHQNSTCKTPLECANMVKSSGSCAYVATRDGYLYKAIADDFQATQKCNLEMGKEEIFTIRSPWALAKNSPYTENINMGIMRAQENGLMNHWMKEYRPNVVQCIHNANGGSKRKGGSNDVEKLSLNNLTVAFIALLVGYFVSLLVLIGESFLFGARRRELTTK